MENGVVVKIEEGLPQGGSLFLLLANSYRDKCLPEEMFHASAAQMTLYFWEKADTPRRDYWRIFQARSLHMAVTKERLVRWGFYDIATTYQSVYVTY